MQLQQLADRALVAAGALSLAGLLARARRVGGKGDGVARVEVHGAVPVLRVAAVQSVRCGRGVSERRSAYWVAMLGKDVRYPGAGSSSEYSSSVELQARGGSPLTGQRRERVSWGR